MRKILFIILFLLAALLLEGCATFDAIPVVRQFQKKIDLPENCSITFDNLNGDLEIFGWKQASVAIAADKKGTDSQLRQTDIEVVKREDKLSIITLYPRADIRTVFVDFKLSVPEKTLFKEIKISKGDLSTFQVYGEMNASIEEGNIEVEDFSGTCNLFADKGKITARIFEGRATDDFTFKTNEGDIELFLPPELNARIEVETRQGEIQSEYDSDESEEIQLRTCNKSFGKGEAKITVTSWSGNIYLKKIQKTR